MNKKPCPLILAIIYMTFLSVPMSFAGDLKPVTVKKSDKCPVCGMFVSGYKNWQTEVIFHDGSYAVFDGPKDMFRYYFNLKKYNPSKAISDISVIYVTEYYSTELMDARDVFFVVGSDVNGPMGVELVPLASESSAKEFMKDHKGRKILKLREVNEKNIK